MSLPTKELQQRVGGGGGRTYDGVQDDFEERPVAQHSFELHARPAQVDAVFFGGDGHLENVVGLFVVGLPLGGVHELVHADEVQVRVVARHAKSGRRR
jgi:hypothetical protein